MNLVVLTAGVHCRHIIYDRSKLLIHLQEFDETICILFIGTEGILDFDLIYNLSEDCTLGSQNVDRHENLSLEIVLPDHVRGEKVLEFEFLEYSLSDDWLAALRLVRYRFIAAHIII